MPALDRGTMLGGCRIEEPIGRGGMGVVYRAVQVELGRDVAVKVIAPDRVGDAEARRRFLREVRAGAAVEHPNVVPVHGAGTDGDCAYVVMRYVPGTDLRTLVHVEGPLDPERAGVVAECLGDALDALHAAGYVHRDVKPANVLIEERGHVYLSDFGIARELLGTATHTEPGRWVGTIDFAAPEQIRGDPVDARADVYALGAVVFFMLTGHVPFERPTDEARLWAQLADAPPRPSALRPELAAAVDAVVLRALAKHPAERQPSAGALGRDVRAAVMGEPTADAAAPRPARRRRTVVGAAAAAAAVTTAILATLVFTRGEGDGESDGGGAAREPARSAPTPAPVATPATGLVTGTAQNVGFRPRGLAVAAGAVWVISHGRERIARVDAGTLRRTGPQPRIGRGAWSIVADGDAALWVAVPRRGAVLRLDPASGRVTGRIRPPLTPVEVGVGADGLWVAGRARRDVDPHPPDAVFRYDRAGHRVLRIPVPLEVSAIAPAQGGVWIAVNLERKLLRYDTAGRLRRQSQITEPAAEVVFGDGSAWGTIRSVDAVTQVPRGGPSVTTDVSVEPADLALAGGRVFVAGNTDHSVVVLDVDSGRPVGEPIPVGLNPMAVTAGAGHVWVAGMGDNSLTRIAY